MQNFESMFGFNDFSTSKGQDHLADAEEAVYKDYGRKRDYRQFMNKRVAQPRPNPSGGND